MKKACFIMFLFFVTVAYADNTNTTVSKNPCRYNTLVTAVPASLFRYNTQTKPTIKPHPTAPQTQVFFDDNGNKIIKHPIAKATIETPEQQQAIKDSVIQKQAELQKQISNITVGVKVKGN